MRIDLTTKKNIDEIYQSLDFSEIRKNYHDPATNYAFKVMDGVRISGYKMKLACFRHLRDLQRQNTIDFPYYFSTKDEQRILKFAKICPNVDTDEPTALMDWQEFIFGQVKGWKKSDGSNRFSKLILSVARGQGKTYLCAILECYSFLFETMGESNQDLLVSSINADQTMKLFGFVSHMLKQIIEIEPFKSYAKEQGLSLQYRKIIMKNNNNIIHTTSFESGKFDSKHFKLAVTDEIGEITDDVGLSKITSGQTKVPDSLIVEISTSYPNPAVPFKRDQDIVIQAMEEDWNRQADDQLCLIWAQDSINETFPKNNDYMQWAKSNPLLYLDSQKNTLIDGLVSERNSKALSGRIIDFQNKNENIWLESSSDSFLKLPDIERAVIPEFNINGRKVYIGFDYSMMSDNTAFAFVYPYTDADGKQKYHVDQHSFIPWYRSGSIEAKEKQDGINYRELATKGYCTITSHYEGLIDDDQIYHWLLEYVQMHDLDVAFFGYDAMGVNTLIENMEHNTNWPLNPIRQRTGELKNPTKFLQKIFVENTVSRLNDKIMEKALINAQIKEDSVGIQVDKSKGTLKIDVVDAIIDALYQGMYDFTDFAFETDADSKVKRMTQKEVEDWFNDPDSGMI